MTICSEIIIELYKRTNLDNHSFVELLPLSNLTCFANNRRFCDTGDWYNAYKLFLRPVHECVVVGLLLCGFQGTLETHPSV